MGYELNCHPYPFLGMIFIFIFMETSHHYLKESLSCKLCLQDGLNCVCNMFDASLVPLVARRPFTLGGRTLAL